MCWGVKRSHRIGVIRPIRWSIYRMPPLRTRKSTLSEIHFQSSA